jgi:hypothetical protein
MSEPGAEAYTWTKEELDECRWRDLQRIAKVCPLPPSVNLLYGPLVFYCTPIDYDHLICSPPTATRG